MNQELFLRDDIIDVLIHSFSFQADWTLKITILKPIANGI